ncbi:hypothetical protein BGZ65_011409 [Modicella reniformis]|uniref:F-box domain-containing protein n=1 Tax=Modicella reniformis TaxID=1440133 RepID=A0A9P6M1I9_9FUNG|nr:hypothetical protein BGZ65_011409 [Modicella reniformis]
MNSVGQQHQSQSQRLALQELGCHIASFLAPEDIFACCLVSKQWYQDWNPLYWKDVIRKVPKDLSRHGHLIRNLDLSFSQPSDKLARVREHSLNLRSLKLTGYGFTRSNFEEEVLGIRSAPTAEAEVTEEGLQDLENPFILNPGHRNAYLSNTLHSLELSVPPEVCSVLLSRLAQARRAGLLQGLRSFKGRQAIVYYTCIEVDYPESCTQEISNILAFLDTFPELTSFSLLNLNIVRDTGEITAKPICIGREYVNITKLEICPNSLQEFEVLATKMPNVVELLLQPKESNLIPVIQQHFSNLTSLSFYMDDHEYSYDLVDDYDIASQRDIYKDWIQLFSELPNLEKFKTRMIFMPQLVLESLARSCPKLKSFKAVEQFTSLLGVQFMLRCCTALKDLHVSMVCPDDFFIDNHQPWKAPLENLHLAEVSLKYSEGVDMFRKRIRHWTRLKSLRIGHAFSMSIKSLLDSEDCRAVSEETRSFLPWTEELYDKEDGSNRSRNRDSIDLIYSVSNAKGSRSGCAAPAVVAPHYPCLEELILECVPKVSPEGIYWRMVDIMPRLRSLQLDITLSEKDILKMRGCTVPIT